MDKIIKEVIDHMEYLTKLTGGQSEEATTKRLIKELKKISKSDFCKCGQIKHVGYDQCVDCC